MPRKRKNTSKSPTRKPFGTEHVAAFTTDDCKSLPLSPDSLDMSQSTCSALEEELLSSMSEMFSDLDPGVVYMVLSESDFKVDVAMDYLLELSTAATGTPSEYPAEGTAFDSIAASLNDVSQQRHVDDGDALNYSLVEEFEHFGSPPEKDLSPNTLLTEDLDYLIQNEFEKCQQGDVMLSSNLQTAPVAGMDPKSFSVETPKHADMCQSLMESDSLMSSCPQTTWNPMACEFYPPGYHRFITPVVCSPTQWKPVLDQGGLGRGVHVSPPVSSHGRNGNPVSSKVQGEKQGNQKIHPVSQSPVLHRVNKKKRLVGKVLLVLRGVPGSGKSTVARTLLEQNPSGIILSTDDYFCKNGQYLFDPNCLEEAHAWNQKKAKEAFEKTISPIIIDNTNIHAWEMKPYVSMAVRHKYTVVFREPDTWWKYKPKELERRNIHGVTKEKIKRMLNNYERHVSVNSIMNSSASSKSYLNRSFDQDDGDGVPTCAKEETPQSSCFTKFSLRGEEKPMFMPDSSSLLEINTGYTAQDVSKPQKRKETETEEAGAEAGIVEEGSTVCFSGDALDKEDVLLRSQDAKDEESVATTVEMGSCLDCVTAQETMPFVERIPESSDMHPFRIPPENENVDGMLQSSKEEKTEERNSVLPSSLRPELLNFVGDWPVEQSMGQRMQRNKRIHTAWSRQSCDASTATNQQPLKSSEEASEESEVDWTNIQEQAFHKETIEDAESQDAAGLPSIPLAASNQHDLEDLVIPGECPVSFTLEQRQRGKSQKNSLNKDDFESDAGDRLHLSDLDTAEDPQMASDNTGTMQNPEMSTFQDNEMATCETNRQTRPSQNRRAFKHRKLALTFTQNSTSFSETWDPLFNCELQDDVPEKNICASCQTEPQEFAILWRLEKKTATVSEFTKVLIGKVDRFKAKEMNATIGSSDNIPYRVMHDKSTCVEESELIEEDEMENLKNLCKMFRSVSFDVLKDLYERCNKDIGWATNLLLDSGEKMHKDDDTEESSEFNADQAALEPSLTLLKVNNEDHFDILDENTQNIAVSSCNHQSENNTLSDCNTEREMVEAKQGSGNEVTDLSVRQSSSTSTKEQEHTDILPFTDAEISGKNNIQSFVFAKSPEPHAIVRDVEHKHHPSVDKLEIQPLDAMDPCAANTSLSACKLTVTEEVAAYAVEAELNESCEVEDEKIPVQTISQVVANDKQETLKSEETQNILQFTDVYAEDVDEENQVAFQEARTDTQNSDPMSSKSLKIDCLQLSLPPELAFQLRELFGPVGIDLGSLTVEDCVVHIDLNLAKVIHEKWKESIMERQQQEALSYQLIMEDEQFWLENPELPPAPQIEDNNKQLKTPENMTYSNPGLVGMEIMQSIDHQKDFSDKLPFMDHWNIQNRKVSLRKIMSEEVAFQEQQDLKQVSPRHRKDGAAIVKEKQLFQMFPHVDQKLLMDIFMDSNYSLEQTETFFKSVLEADPVQNIVAPEIVQQSKMIQSYRADVSRVKRKKSKVDEDVLCQKYFQDMEDPEYDDFRTEAFLHRSKQQECFRKAAEAFTRGMKEVATFYAQQGRLHGQKMKEANHLAALQIFNRVNESLLPENVLDLHGLHVDEAMNHLRQILQEKTEEYKHTGGKPYLSVITGRGNHSQGGVARIKPAVIDYLNSHSFRFKEIKSGCLQVMLK